MHFFVHQENTLDSHDKHNLQYKKKTSILKIVIFKYQRVSIAGRAGGRPAGAQCDRGTDFSAPFESANQKEKQKEKNCVY